MDVMKALKQMPDESVDMQICSPPYWGLRDYGVERQIGLESTFNKYINKLYDIFDEVKRVLKKDGTCWVNLGDTYARGGNTEERFDKKSYGGKATQHDTTILGRGITKELPAKCLCAIPERFMIEMINRGWILRNTIIWNKPNAFPTSVKDRFTVDFEYLFFFSKSKKYYFKQLREPHKLESIERTKKKWNGRRPPKSSWQGMDMKKMCHPEGRNMGTTWNINTESNKLTNFAVFPEKLVERPIKTTRKDAIIMDIFAGSGTTLKVARDLGRDSIGIEIKKEYCDLIFKRLYNGNKPLDPNEYKLIK